VTDPATPDKRDHLLEIAWGVIANVSLGDWTKQPVTWQEAAAKWRDDWIALLNEQSGGAK